MLTLVVSARCSVTRSSAVSMGTDEVSRPSIRRGPVARPSRSAAASTRATRQPPCTIPGQDCRTAGASSRLCLHARVSASDGGPRHDSGYLTSRRKRAATSVIRGLEFVASGPFARATVTNFVFMSSLSCLILLPLYIQRLGGTEAEIGFVQGMYSAAGIVCQPLIGLWLDRMGRRFFMLLGVALLLFASIGFLVLFSVPLLALLRAVQGIGFSAFFVANYMHVVELVPVERRGWALGIYGVSGFLGTALAPLIGELVVRRL